VKFGFPMAFSVTLLSWSAVEYRDEVAAAGQLRYLRSAIQWGADFLLRAHTSPTTLYTQVQDLSVACIRFAAAADADADAFLLGRRRQRRPPVLGAARGHGHAEDAVQDHPELAGVRGRRRGSRGARRRIPGVQGRPGQVLGHAAPGRLQIRASSRYYASYFLNFLCPPPCMHAPYPAVRESIGASGFPLHELLLFPLILIVHASSTSHHQSEQSFPRASSIVCIGIACVNCSCK